MKLYLPTEEEKKIIAKANSEFVKHYLGFMMLGFTASFYTLKRLQIPLRSRQGALSIFCGGLMSEFIGRRIGKYKAQTHLDLLTSPLTTLIKHKGEFDGQVLVLPNPHSKGDFDKFIGLNGKIYDESGDIGNNASRTTESALVIEFDQKKKNKYGDSID